MVESIRENGVIIPIIVSPIDDFTYEILSGHNRVEAAKAAELEYIPAIVRENLSAEEALLIVTETNLIQRSFSDMTHSERAVTLSMHHDAIKRQGRRSDLIREIDNMLNASNTNALETSSPVEKKLTSMEEIGQNYALSKESVARYLRIDKLINELKARLDDGEIALRAAVTVSYLASAEQEMVEDVLDSSHYKLDMKKAESLRAASGKKPLDHEAVEQILAGTRKPRAARPPAFKLKPKIISRYFAPEQKPDEIEATIIEALDFYYAQKKLQERGLTHDGGTGENLSADDTAGTPLASEIPNG
jgi:ParB family chromosome partitioning protein